VKQRLKQVFSLPRRFALLRAKTLKALDDAGELLLKHEWGCENLKATDVIEVQAGLNSTSVESLELSFAAWRNHKGRNKSRIYVFESEQRYKQIVKSISVLKTHQSL